MLTALTKPTGSVLGSSVDGGGSQVHKWWLPTFSVTPGFLFQAQGDLMPCLTLLLHKINKLPCISREEKEGYISHNNSYSKIKQK